ncbi:hypothetical protein ACQKL0_15065 [Peribacillus sp. NPDC097264]
MNKQTRKQPEKKDKAQYVRTEFGMEFSEDMNATEIYEILAAKNNKK